MRDCTVNGVLFHSGCRWLRLVFCCWLQECGSVFVVVLLCDTVLKSRNPLDPSLFIRFHCLLVVKYVCYSFFFSPLKVVLSILNKDTSIPTISESDTNSFLSVHLMSLKWQNNEQICILCTMAMMYSVHFFGTSCVYCLILLPQILTCLYIYVDMLSSCSFFFFFLQLCFVCL